ncbi:MULTISPECIES: hypothetical protein [Clostridium]|jgi:hypothetical protein|uniref:Uncharacterized protein n=1 Tax=Clostridium lapidicellarium TaxID=3240931 RepID=A0ABV4E0V1_9CLOT|nr:hypothetical protein [uncultured Clostridium sp.]NLU07528.1 hypothetical protein [Clostridiales bacterium]
MMTKSEFLKKAEEICLRDDCSISNAIDAVIYENKITNAEFIALFCKGKSSIG